MLWMGVEFRVWREVGSGEGPRVWRGVSVWKSTETPPMTPTGVSFADPIGQWSPLIRSIVGKGEEELGQTWKRGGKERKWEKPGTVPGKWVCCEIGCHCYVSLSFYIGSVLCHAEGGGGGCQRATGPGGWGSQQGNTSTEE